jgi:hypothetical protein
MSCNFFYCQPRVLTSRLDHKIIKCRYLPTKRQSKPSLQSPKFKKHKTKEKEEPENSMDDYGSRDRAGSTIT